MGKWHFHGGKIHNFSPVVETTSTRISGMKGVVSKETVVLSRWGRSNHQFHTKKEKKKERKRTEMRNFSKTLELVSRNSFLLRKKKRYFAAF